MFGSSKKRRQAKRTEPPGFGTEAGRYGDVVTAPPTAGTRAPQGRTAPAPPDVDTFGDPVTERTGQPRYGDGADGPITQPSRPNTMTAPARARQQKGKPSLHTPVVPPASVTGRSLTLVISIMCFLACLTAGAVYMINQSADAWLRDIASEVTVQIEPKENGDISKEIADVAQFLRNQSGIQSATPLSLDVATDLLEPWLGQSDALKSLPVPRLIAVDVNRVDPPDFERLRSRLKEKFSNATLDDHRQWTTQIRTVTRSFALGGIAILLLVAAATTAIIVSAARSAMASNRDIVEVLHFVGATDRFIAREFEKHFLALGIRAGVVGAGAAMFVFFVMPLVTQLLGGDSVTTAEFNRFLGGGTLDLMGYALLAGVVVVVAALCMITSRLGVYRILNSQH